jgi:hypothetical protein
MYKEEIYAICKFQKDYFLEKKGSLTEKEKNRLSITIDAVDILNTIIKNN